MFNETEPKPVSVTGNADATTSSMHPVLARIYLHLSTHRGGPLIDPVDVEPDLLPHLFIVMIERDSHDDPPRLRIRLTGSALDNAFGRCVKAYCLEEFLHGGHSSDVLDGFRACASPGEARWMRQVITIADRAPRFVEGVAVHVVPNRIYGGLIFGELARSNAAAGFEIRRL